MADRTVRIKLDVDGSKATVTLNSVNSGLEKQVGIVNELNKQETITQQYERVSNQLIADKNKLLKELATKVANISNSPKLNDALALNAALASAEKYNRELDKIRAKSNDLRIAASGIGSLSSSGYSQAASAPGTPRNPDAVVNYATGQVQSQRAINATNEALLEQHNARIRALNEQTDAHYRRLAENRAFREQADRNARVVQYADMFRQIEAREQASVRQSNNINSTRNSVANTAQLRENTVARNLNTAAVEAAIRPHRSLAAHIAEIVGIYRVYNTILNATGQFLRDIPIAGIEQQATQNSLLGIFGTDQGTQNLSFISKVADKAGQSLVSLEQSYRKYAPSAILAGASQEEVNQSFRDFAEVATLLQLPEDKVNSIFLALDQIFSKGVVQSEEIKKQLGNVLPAAIEIGAQAFGKSPAAFLEAMKKNEVIAKDFVPKFAKLYREIFGGPNDSVFKQASQGFLANLLRVQTEYTRLNRAIFESTQDTMTGVIKLSAEALTVFQNNLAGIGQAIELFADLIITRLSIAAIGGLITNFGLILTKINAFSVLLTGLSAPVVGLTGYIGNLILNLNGLSVAYESANGFVVRFGEEQVGLVNYIQTYVLETINDLRNAILNLTSIDVSGWWKNIVPSAKDFQEVRAFFGTIQELGNASQKLPESLDDIYARKLKEATSNASKPGDTFVKTQAKELEETVKSFTGKSALAVSKAIADGKLKTNEQITAALANTRELAPTTFKGGIPGEAALTKQTGRLKEQNKALQNLYKETGREIKLITEETKANLAELDTKYEDNVISIKDYYETKRKLQLQAIADEQTAYEQAQRIASKTGDSGKVEEFKDKIDQTKSQAKEVLAQYNRQEIVDNRNLLQVLEEINIEYLKLTGNVEQAGLKQFDLQNKAKTDLLRANSNAPGVKEAQERQDLNRQHEQYVNRLLISTDRQKIANDTLANEELRLNTNRNAGLDTQLDFMLKIEEARKSAVKTLEAELILDEQSAARNKATGAELQDLTNRRAALQALKQDAEVTANFMRTTFSEAFSNNFSDFILGTKTAGEAFASFGQSILKTIADIAAQQLAKSLIGLAFSAFSGAAGAAGSSGGGGIVNGGGNLSGQIGSFLGSSKGNVFQNSNVIPFARGGIPDIGDKLQYFPMANGGIGSLRENGKPEAIMPLARNSNGKLGVEAINGAAGSGGNIYQITVNVQSAKNETSDQTGQKIAVEIMKTIARKEIQESQRVGNRTTKVG